MDAVGLSSEQLMPRSVEEILAHAEDSADRFESYEPDPADEIDVTVLTHLRVAVEHRVLAEREVVEAVWESRGAGLSWSTIGSLVGSSGEAARQRDANLVA